MAREGEIPKNAFKIAWAIGRECREGSWGVYTLLWDMSLDKKEKATENQMNSEVLHVLCFSSDTDQMDPISFIIKTSPELLEIDVREEHVFHG